MAPRDAGDAEALSPRLSCHPRNGMDEVLRMKGHGQVHTGVLQEGFWDGSGTDPDWEGRRWAQAELRTVERRLCMERQVHTQGGGDECWYTTVLYKA